MPTFTNFQNSTNLGRIEELESLRGIASLLVVFYHIPKWNALLNIGIINNGYLMVELFFVLSGFVIYNAYANKISTVNDLMRFQFLRLGRLYPVHLLFLMAYFLIEVAKYFAEIKFGISSPNTQPFKENSLTAFFQQIFLLQSIGPTGNATTYNGPAWSISSEFFTYLLFGIILLLARKNKNAIFLIISLISLFMLATEMTYGTEYLIRCFAGFFIGCLTAFITKKISFSFPSFTLPLIFLFIIFFLQFKTTGNLDLITYFLTALLIAFLTKSKSGFLKDILRRKIFIWLGSISYAMYMSHALIIWVANQFFRFVLKKQEIMIDGKSYPQLSLTETLIVLALIFSIIFLVSHFVYTFIEKPMREKSRLIASKKIHVTN